MRAILVVAACASALWLAPTALGQTPVQFVTAAGTALDNSEITEEGNWGPCTVAVSASREAFAGSDTNVGGSGSFLVSGGPGRPDQSVCVGAPVSMRFDVIAVRISENTATIDVRVTDSDDPTIIGATGTIVANDATNRVEVSIAGRSGGFGPDRAVYSGFIDTIADVHLGNVTTTAVTHYSGTGTANDVSPDLAVTRGDCVMAVAGIFVPGVADPPIGGGTFQTGFSSGGDVGTCFGPLGSTYRYAVTAATTDGEANAALGVTTTDIFSGVAGPGGSIAIDEPANSVSYDVPPHAGGFVQPGLFGIIATRAGARVDTKVYAVLSTECSVNGGGYINDRQNFGLNARSTGGEDADGHLNYRDHNNGLHVRSVDITSIVCNGNSATIRGVADTNTGRQEFRVDVTDNGEPGRNDTFSIQLLPSGYTAAGTLRGGNLQVR